MLVNAHTKGKNTLGGEKNIIKEQNRRFFNPWRFAGTARIGYGNFSVFGTMNFNPCSKTPPTWISGLSPSASPSAASNTEG